jgi:actin-related protein
LNFQKEKLKEIKNISKKLKLFNSNIEIVLKQERFILPEILFKPKDFYNINNSLGFLLNLKE